MPGGLTTHTGTVHLYAAGLADTGAGPAALTVRSGRHTYRSQRGRPAEPSRQGHWPPSLARYSWFHSTTRDRWELIGRVKHL